jgi:galactofuranose transport system ATP-binding protein
LFERDAPGGVMLVSMKGIDKAFSGAPALIRASLEVREGEVMALIGQNGAGKSTIIKILTGAYRKDAGIVLVSDKEADFRSTGESQAAGIATVYQEINLAPNRSVAENIYLGREPLTLGFVNRRKMHADAAKVLERFKLTIDVERPLSEFGAATRQMVAIARGVTQDARLLIMDEPTSSLDESEVSVLFQTIRTLKADGVAIIFISHRLDELYAICDRVTVMRDGRTIAVKDMGSVSKYELVKLMLGKELEAFTASAEKGKRQGDKFYMQAYGLRSGLRVRDVSVSIAQGRITGLAGLLGSGRTETARLLFGADRRDGGGITVAGEQRNYSSPAEAIADGTGFVSEDRKIEGIIPDMSVRENLTLAIMPRLVKAGMVDREKQDAIVGKYIKLLDIKCASPDQPVKELSGGNQQKVLLARWLCMDPKLLLVDEPTRGIDVGAKAEILKLLRALADDGLSVLMVSSELEELVAAADEVTVLSDGVSVENISGPDITEDRLMAAMAHQI